MDVHPKMIEFNKNTQILSVRADNWAKFASDEIVSAINGVLSGQERCSLMLTGGKTAEALYNYWASSGVLPLDRIRFFFGDERCVPMWHPDSNYALVMTTLFGDGDSQGCEVNRMDADNTEYEAASRSYERLLPARIDILLLGMGTDGHVASLFPNSEALQSFDRTVVSVRGAKPPFDRLTITPAVIANAGLVFLLATGSQKGEVLAEALKTPADYVSLPVRLTIGRTWLLDDQAAMQTGLFKGA
jgi:6-phosphogluconolactonase